MKCLKILPQHWIFLFAFCCFCSVFLSFGQVSDSYAVEDITKTYTQYTNSDSICSSDCSSYKYLIIKTHNFYSSNPWSFNNQYLKFNLFWNNNFSSPLGLRGSVVDSVLELSPPSSSSDVLSTVDLATFPAQSALDTLSSGWSIDVILSETNPYASGIIPSGTLSITENGTYDVSNYAQADVNVPSEECPENGACSYNDKFDGVIQAIYTCGAVALVLYFFFCIYRIIIGTTGSQLK